MSIQDYQARATEAGESVGKAHYRLRDLIRDMYQSAGITNYGGPEHKAARGAFAAACEAGGTSRNSGMTLYARAYDSLIEEGLPLEPRARKGAGGRKAKAAPIEPEGYENATSESAPAPISPEEAVARARPMIAAEAVRDFMSANGVTFDVARDAALSYREAAQRREAMPESAHGLIDDLMATILTLGKALEGALKARDAQLESVGLEPVDYANGAAMGDVPEESVGGDRFVNHYHCDACGIDWQDESDSTNDDRCPSCNVAHSPCASEDANVKPAKAKPAKSKAKSAKAKSAKSKPARKSKAKPADALIEASA